MGQGPPPLTGEAQGVLVLSAFGKRGGQAGGAAGHLCAPDGSPALTRLSVPAASGTGLARGRTTVCVSFLPPLSQAHPIQGLHAHIPRGPSPACKPLHLQELRLISPGRGGAGRRHETQWQCRCSHRAESSAGCRCRSSHCRETRGSIPLEAGSASRQGAGVREQSPRGALVRISRRHPFLGRIRPGPGRP